MERSDEIIEAAEARYKDKSNAIKLEDAFHAGARWADRHQHWRDAEVEQPTHPEANSEDSERVLVYDGREGYDIGYYSYKEQRWYTLHENINVSYWMPLSKLPEGGER